VDENEKSRRSRWEASISARIISDNEEAIWYDYKNFLMHCLISLGQPRIWENKTNNRT
jgi:hypothetical protein